MLSQLLPSEALALVHLARRPTFVVRLAGSFCAVFAATLWIGLEDSGNQIWMANGVLLAYLLLAPRWRWPWYFFFGFLAEFSGGILVHSPRWPTHIALASVNIVEVAVAAFLLRRRSSQLPQFTSREFLLRFLVCAVLVGPLISGLLFAALYEILLGASPFHAFLRWITTDSLGIAIATPACVAIFRSRLRDTLEGSRNWIYPVVLIAVVIAAFSQTSLPLIFLVYPLMALILLRFGLGWASLGSLFITAVSSWYTSRGMGPFAQTQWDLPSGPAILLQLFIAGGVFMIYAASTVLDDLRATQHKLRKTVAIHNLVTQNSRDIVLITDDSGIPSYVSPAVFPLTGWRPDERVSRPFAEVMHPDDLPRLKRMIAALRQGATEGIVEHRVRHRSGGWIWMESKIRSLDMRPTGGKIGIIIVAREISKRKCIEQTRDFHQSVLTAINETSLDGVLVVNQDGNVVSYNRRFSEVWNIDAPDLSSSMLDNQLTLSDEILLTRCLDRIRDPATFLARVQELYANPETVDRCEVELLDGRTLERYSSCLRSASGKYLGRVWFFRDISAHKAAQKELQQAYCSLEALVVTDALTRIANRRRFDQCLTTEWRRCMRDHLPLSLLLIDVDLFKSYNDTYGHLRGDSCLKQIAEAMQDVVSRPADLVARYGGEEFAVILPRSDTFTAAALAERVAHAVRRRRLEHSSNPLGYLTISIGCATIVPSLGQHSSMLISRADEALYQAKRNGRNQVFPYEIPATAAFTAQAS